jgi:hypothetical protein
MTPIRSMHWSNQPRTPIPLLMFASLKKVAALVLVASSFLCAVETSAAASPKAAVHAKSSQKAQAHKKPAAPKVSQAAAAPAAPKTTTSAVAAAERAVDNRASSVHGRLGTDKSVPMTMSLPNTRPAAAWSAPVIAMASQGGSVVALGHTL